jgi:hypothetical protein
MKKLAITKINATPTEVQPSVYPFFFEAWKEKRPDGNCDPVPDNANCKKCQVNLYRNNQPGKITGTKKPAKPVAIKNDIRLHQEMKKEHLRWEFMRRRKKLRAYYDFWQSGKKIPEISGMELEYREIFNIFKTKSFEEYWEKSRRFWVEEIPKVFPPSKVENFLERLLRKNNQIDKEKGRSPTPDELLDSTTAHVFMGGHMYKTSSPLEGLVLLLSVLIGALMIYVGLRNLRTLKTNK